MEHWIPQWLQTLINRSCSTDELEHRHHRAHISIGRSYAWIDKNISETPGPFNGWHRLKPMAQHQVRHSLKTASSSTAVPITSQAVLTIPEPVALCCIPSRPSTSTPQPNPELPSLSNLVDAVPADALHPSIHPPSSPPSTPPPESKLPSPSDLVDAVPMGVLHPSSPPPSSPLHQAYFSRLQLDEEIQISDIDPPDEAIPMEMEVDTFQSHPQPHSPLTSLLSDATDIEAPTTPPQTVSSMPAPDFNLILFPAVSCPLSRSMEAEVCLRFVYIQLLTIMEQLEEALKKPDDNPVDSATNYIYILNIDLRYKDLVKLHREGWLNNTVMALYCALVGSNARSDVLVLDNWLMASLESEDGWERVKTWRKWKVLAAF